ncbi:histone-lysine N-methyltransferase SETMAR [Trichonephila clavipes]|nr:histone-lysine N-methyltransferase SETMAR [Trichonephila clavipes]
MNSEIARPRKLHQRLARPISCFLHASRIQPTGRSSYIFRIWDGGSLLEKSTIDDESRSGRPVNFDDAILRNLVESEPQLTVNQITERVNSSHGTVFQHLKKIGKVSELGKWVPHELSEANCQQQINICTSLLSRFEIEPFLDRLVTGDGKCIIYHNVKRKRTWIDKDKHPILTTKVSLHPQKILLSVLCNMYGAIYFELLEPNQMINSEVNSELLCHL